MAQQEFPGISQHIKDFKTERTAEVLSVELKDSEEKLEIESRTKQYEALQISYITRPLKLAGEMLTQASRSDVLLTIDPIGTHYGSRNEPPVSLKLIWDITTKGFYYFWNEIEVKAKMNDKNQLMGFVLNGEDTELSYEQISNNIDKAVNSPARIERKDWKAHSRRRSDAADVEILASFSIDSSKETLPEAWMDLE